MRDLNLKTKTSIFIKAAIAMFVIFCVATLLSQQFQRNELKKQEAQLRVDILENQYDIEEIQEELEEPFNDEYVKKVARKRLGYHMPEEILFFNNLIK